MKKIILILLISLSSISFAIGQNARNISNIPLNAVNPIVAQHAQSSGISFTSNQSQYQLILGGRAILQNDNSVAAQIASSSSNNIWSDQKGSYQLSIGISSNNGAMSSNLDNNTKDFNLIAFNSSSNGIAIINDDIIVKLLPNYFAEEIAATFNINLVENFTQINTAMYQVNKGQDMFAITQRLQNHPGVEFAEIDVTEHLLIAK